MSESMAEEQAIRSELLPPPPPPPSEVNDVKSKASRFWCVFGDSAGTLGFQGGENEFIKKNLFWIQLLAGILVLVVFIDFILMPLISSVASEPVASCFIPAACILTRLGNCLFFVIYIKLSTKLLRVLGKDENRTGSTDKGKTEQEKAKLEFSSKESKEEVKAEEGKNKKDEENTRQEKASWKDSTEEVTAKDESLNKIEEENTGGQKAKLDFTLKEENDRKSVDKFYGWEEERSQLIYELGAARASAEIYKELLHDLHHNDQPYNLIA